MENSILCLSDGANEGFEEGELVMKPDDIFELGL